MRRYKFKTTSFRLFPLVFACWMFLCPSPLPRAIAADEEGGPSAAVAASDSKALVTINMVDADISTLIETISKMTGKNFIIDDNVRGKVNIVSSEKISPEDAYRLFESALEVKGYALVPAGKAIKVVPAAEARTKNIETRVKSQAANPEDKLITQLIPLKYADAKEVKTLFTPLVSKNSVILAYTDTNTLIVTDVESNIKRLLHIKNAIDVPGIGREVSTVPLQYADAETLVKSLSSVFKTSMSEEKGVSQKTLQFVADQRTNTVIFVASEDDTNRIKQLISLLDKETPKGKGKAHVIPLNHANAEEVAKVLQDLPKGNTSSTAANGKEAPVVSGDITILADKATNKLIVFADSADYAVIQDIIDKLDVPRSMVYIQALIMEVSVDKTFELGVEWSAFTDTTVNGNNTVVGGGFNPTASTGSTNAEQIAAGLLSPNGGAMGVVSGSVELTTSAGTYEIPNLGALIKALRTDEDVQILSTPRLLTTDNEEASIVVGKKIPYQTRTSTTNNETYNSYDYQTVGLTLKITPHISEERNVRLEIHQELSALTGASTDITVTPTTLNRTVDTTVIVQDQNMLIIGGLIDDNITHKVTKVPLLGSIPILGRLFRYDSQIGSKTNLYIFITPRVVKNPAEANTLTTDVQDTLSPVESGLIKLYGPVEGAQKDKTPDAVGTAE